MKKIICTVTNDLHYDQRMIRVCTTLTEAGYEVLLVGRETGQSVPLAVRPFAQKRFRLPFEKGKLFYAAYNARLFFFLLFARFDAVYAVDLDSLVPGFLVSKLRRKHLVFDAHEYFTEVPEVVERPRVKRVWEAVAKQLIPKISHAITVCQSLAVVFEQHYGTPFQVVRNVPFRKPAPDQTTKPEPPFILLYQGVLNEGRGIEEAVLALKQLDSTVHLWLAGEGDLSGEIRKLVGSEGLSERVRFLGKVSPAELPALTLSAHIGLNLLKNKGLNYYYSLANKAFDYVQAEIPCLCMRFPEYVRLQTEHEVFELLDTLSPSAVAQAVRRLRDDKHHYARLAANCHAAAEKWHWDNEKTVLLRLFENLWT